jgi:hypothetical protein
MVWATSVFIFVGMQESFWSVVDPLLQLLAYMTACLSFYFMLTASFSFEVREFSGPIIYMVMLMWFGGWTLLTAGNSTGLRFLLRSFPFAVFIFSSVFTQTRSRLLMAILLFASLLLLNKRIGCNWINRKIKIMITLHILIIVFLLTALLFTEPLLSGLDRFSERLAVDSRSGQYVEFFSQVPFSDLLLGRGPNASYVFGAREEYQFFDNAYLWVAFIGGLPLLIPYFCLIILPGINAYRLGAQGKDAAAAILVILCGLAFTGLSTYSHPDLSPNSYVLYLMSGRCLGYLAENSKGSDSVEAVLCS